MFTSSHDRAMFTLGACFLLAKAINDLTGWPICAFWSPFYADYDGHAFVRTPQGTYLDIEGEHQHYEFCERWNFSQVREVPCFSAISDWGACMIFDYAESEQRARELAPALIAQVTPCLTIQRVAPCPSP